MTTTETQRWIDVIPRTVPLARAVPIFGRLHGVRPDGRSEPVKAIVEYVRVDGEGYAHYKSSSMTFSAEDVVIDLDERQGFSYALDHWATHVDACFYTSSAEVTNIRRAYGISWIGHAQGLRERHLRRKTTDDDRLRLARRIAEMETS